MILKSEQIVIIGGGILGLSIARKFLLDGYKNVTLLEKERTIANHQSSKNSGVIHAGLYYNPKSLKAQLCRKGLFMMKDFCNRNSIPWEECGKIVVATESNEISRLKSLMERGNENGLKGLKMLSSKEVNSYEPYVDAKEGILVPEESIVNYKDVAKKIKEEIIALDGNINLSSKVVGINHLKNSEEIILESGKRFNAETIISTSGLYSDKVAEMLGIPINEKKILPFRGEYYLLKKPFEYLVKGLV